MILIAIIFNFLSLALFGGLLYFAYLNVKREIRSYTRSAVRRVRVELVEVKAQNSALKSQLDVVNLRLQKNGMEPLKLPGNPFKAMEDRYESEFSKHVVKVNGEERPTG